MTNEDAPRFRVFVTEAGEYDRDGWKEIIPQTGGVLKEASIYGGKIFAQYEQNASSQLKVFRSGGRERWRAIWIYRGLELFWIPAGSGIMTKFFTDSNRSPLRLRFIVTTWSRGLLSLLGQG